MMRQRSWKQYFFFMWSALFCICIAVFSPGSASFSHTPLMQKSGKKQNNQISGYTIQTDNAYLEDLDSHYNSQTRSVMYQLTAGLRPGHGDPIPAAQDVHDLPVTDVSFYNLRGYLLSGWIAISSPDAPVIILTHGTPGDRVSMIQRAAFLYRHGYNVLLFDFQSYGKSEGVMSTLGMVESEDILSAITYLRTRPDTTSSKIGVLGLSMGATAAVLAASRTNDITALVAESCPVDATRVPGDVPDEDSRQADKALVEQVYGVDITKARPIDAINKLEGHTALFLINGDSDTTTPLDGMYQLFQSAGSPKQYWVVPGAGHAQSFDVDTPDYEDQVDSFFDTYFSSTH